MKVKVGVSARHIHITEEDYKLLFDEEINVKKYLNQPGEFASDKKVTISNNEKSLIATIVGPFRTYTQVEMSKTDAHYLKLEVPVKKSGDLEEAAEITISTEKGSIKRKAAIIPARHIHVTKEQREEFGLFKDSYTIKVNGEKGGTFDNVTISESPKSYFEMHIDTDDANAFLINCEDEVEIIK